MNQRELELFGMINAARVDNGCAELRRDSRLTGNARGHAGKQAEGDSTRTGAGTDAIADGDGNESTQTAFNRMMNSYRSTLLDCGRDRLGIGYGSAEHRYGLLGLFTKTESRWVADFS